MNKNGGIENIRHSLAHLLAMAVLKKIPSAKLGIGPVIENGFYYDFLFNADQRGSTQITESDLTEIETAIRELIEKKLDFSGKKITSAQAQKIFKDQPFKLELIKEYAKEGRELTVYKTGEKFVDLCKGGHAKNTAEINPETFRLTHIAGAYWRGSEKNPMLTRIYGVAFDTKKELDEYFKMREEAEKRDHKKLGSELDLFIFSELIGSGLPLWTPKGTLIRNILDDFVWQLRKKAGYEQVDIPHLTKIELYKKSGHWDKFKDELFKITTREGHLFAVKPMNCPHHTQIYARRQWSYRELPQRYASTTKCYRDEQSGELAGLSRARSFTQDDAPVFCRMSQTKEEFLKIWEIVHTFYSAFGLSLRIRLSLHDPKQPEKYLGDQSRWKDAENILRGIASEQNANIFEGVGEAAFYGPKLDFMAKDSLGREYQVATIQLDMNMPDCFDLACINEKGEKERIVMIHAAIMGSIERFLSILIEHYAGAFPFWLAPVQIAILTINDSVCAYAGKIAQELRNQDYRVSMDDRNETIGKKIREAELQKIPYILILGNREAESGKIAVRERGKGDLGQMILEKFMELVQAQKNPL